MGGLISHHSHFWSLPTTPPRASAAPNPAPSISVTILSSSSIFPGAQLRYAQSTIHNFEIFNNVSPFIWLVEHVALIIQCYRYFNGFFTAEYELTSAYPQDINTKRSSLQCWWVDRQFLSVIENKKSWTMPTTPLQPRGSVWRQSWNKCLLC